MIQCHVGVKSLEHFARHVTSLLLELECVEAIIVMFEAALYEKAESKINCSMPWLMQQIRDAHKTTIVLVESLADLMDVMRVLLKKLHESKHLLATYNFISLFTDKAQLRSSLFAHSDEYLFVTLNNVVHDMFNLQLYNNVSVIMGETEQGPDLWSRRAPCAQGTETEVDLIAKKWLVENNGSISMQIQQHQDECKN